MCVIGGDSDGVFGNGIAIDKNGNAYITGNTQSSNFPTTFGAFQTVFGGGDAEAFVTKLNSAGNELFYSTYLGGSDNDQGSAISIDENENVYVTGNTKSSDFPITSGAFQSDYGGGAYDAFFVKLNSEGNALLYSTYLGGSGNDFGLISRPAKVNIGGKCGESKIFKKF